MNSDSRLALLAAVTTAIVLGYQLYAESMKKKTVKGEAWKSAEVDETHKLDAKSPSASMQMDTTQKTSVKMDVGQKAEVSQPGGETQQTSARGSVRKNSQSRKGTRSDVESYSLAPKAQETKQLASIALAPPSPAEASTNLAPVFLSDTESSTSKNSKNKDRKKKEKKKSERKAVNKAEQNNTANTAEEDGVKTANLISDGKEETQGVKTAENFSDGESIDIKTAKGIE